MKGMVFAAGIGTRLKPWTDFHPKALAEVGVRPILGRVIDRLFEAGVTEVLVNVHHFAGQITDYISRNYAGRPVAVSDESDLLLDTGGGLRKALPLIGNEAVLVHNADIFTDIDLRRFAAAHRTSGVDVSLLTGHRDTTRQFLFGDGRLYGWTNTATGALRPASLESVDGLTPLAFNGVHLLSPQVYPLLRDYAADGQPFSITDFYIDTCPRLAIAPVVMPAGSVWFDIGKPATLEAARAYVSSHNIH